MNKIKAYALILILFGSLLISGCTTPAKSENMAIGQINLGRAHPYSVAVEAGKRDYSDKAGMAQIGDMALKEAIIESLKSTGLFESVVEIGESQYLIYATITAIKQPVVGLSFTVPMTTNWKLIEVSTEKTVWHTSIDTAYTAGMGEAVVGATRLRKATEGSMRDAIEKALIEMSKVEL